MGAAAGAVVLGGIIYLAFLHDSTSRLEPLSRDEALVGLSVKEARRLLGVGDDDVIQNGGQPVYCFYRRSGLFEKETLYLNVDQGVVKSVTFIVED